MAACRGMQLACCVGRSRHGNAVTPPSGGLSRFGTLQLRHAHTMPSVGAWRWTTAQSMHRAFCTCSALGVWPRHCLADRLASLPGMKEKLETGIKIADVGCGCVWSFITFT